MWKYYLEANKWEEVIPFGVNAVTRRVNLWDGNFENVTVNARDLKVSDDIHVSQLNKTHPDPNLLFPIGRAGHTMILIGNPPYYVIIYGGFKEVMNNNNISVH